MANLFYGVSTSGSADQVKEVTLYNPVEEGVQLGDIVAVYFSQSNTEVAPSILIKETGTQIDSSISHDQIETSTSDGEFIKTINNIDNVDYMWRDGEVCLFVLVSHQFNNNIDSEYTAPTQDPSDALYYMLIRGTRANSEYYGLTKLFAERDDFGEDKEFLNVEAWITQQEYTNRDMQTAATPYLVKRVAQAILGDLNKIKANDESEQAITPVAADMPNISYESRLEEGEETLIIGDLIVGDDHTPIKIPMIVTTSESEPTSSGYKKVDYTNDIYNNADIITSGNKMIHKYASDAAGDGQHFITNVLPSESLYLCFPRTGSISDSGLGVYYAQPVASSTPGAKNFPVEGNNLTYNLIAKEISGSSPSIVIGNRDDAINTYGTNHQFWAPNEDSYINALTIGGSDINATIPVKSTEFFEANQSLKNRYSGKLVKVQIEVGTGENYNKTGTLGGISDADAFKPAYRRKIADGDWVKVNMKSNADVSPLKVAADSYSGHRCTGVYVPGYKPLGIIGYNLNYGKDNQSDAYYNYLWELYLAREGLYNATTGKALIVYSTKNTKNKDTYIRMVVTLLCEKIL